MNEQPEWMLLDEERPEVMRNWTVANAMLKAQVKKVVEEISKHIQDRAYRIGFAPDVYLDGNWWQQLRKDVGL